MDARKNLGCAQAQDLGSAISRYEGSGCTQTRRFRNGCVLLDCPGNNLYVCEARDVSVSPHDEIDEVADAFWTEEP